MRESPSAFGRKETLRGGLQPSTRSGIVPFVSRRTMIKGLVAGALGGGGYGGWKLREEYLRTDMRKRMDYLHHALSHDGVQMWEQGYDGVATRIVVLITLPECKAETRDQWSQDVSGKLSWLEERYKKAYEVPSNMLIERKPRGIHAHLSGIQAEDADRFQIHTARFHATPRRSQVSDFDRQRSYFDALAVASPLEPSPRGDLPILLAYEESPSRDISSLDQVASQWNRERTDHWERPLHIVRLEFSRHFNPSPELAEHIAER